VLVLLVGGCGLAAALSELPSGEHPDVDFRDSGGGAGGDHVSRRALSLAARGEHCESDPLDLRAAAAAAAGEAYFAVVSAEQVSRTTPFRGSARGRHPGFRESCGA
jgi:hypothetical protein